MSWQSHLWRESLLSSAASTSTSVRSDLSALLTSFFSSSPASYSVTVISKSTYRYFEFGGLFFKVPGIGVGGTPSTEVIRSEAALVSAVEFV